MMKNSLFKVVSLVLIIVSAIAMSSCGKLFGTDDDSANSGSGKKIEISDDMTDEEAMEVINNGIEFEEEADGTNLHFRQSDELEYLGKWEATSGQSIYMYGVMELNILPAGKWTGTIVDEKVSGNWTFEKNKMNLTSEWFEASLSFTADGKLIMQENRGEDGEDDIVTTVLTKRE